MKKPFKRMLCAALAACVSLTAAAFSACKTESVIDDYERIDPGVLPEKQAGKDYSPLKKYDSVVTIKVLGTDFTAIGEVPATYKGKPSGPANNAFNDAALQYLNIKLEYVSTVSGERYADRLNTLIAGGELPDIFRVTDATTFETLKKSQLIADIADDFYYLNDEFQAMYKSDLYKPALESCMEKGKLYAFPNVQNPYETAQKLYIRKDWLDLCGLDLPTTYEELVAAAEAFKNHAAEIAATSDLAAKDIIPIGITKEIAAVGNGTAAGLFNLFGAQPDAFFNVNGKLVDSNLSSEMKTALAEINKLYSKGLLAKEFYNYTDSKVSNDIIAGKVGIVSGMRHIATYPLQESVSNEATPSAEWVAIELPPVNGTASKPVVERVLIQDYNCVSRSCAYPDALAKLSNLFYDMFYNDNAYEIYGSLSQPSGGFFYSWVPAKIWYTPYTIDSYKRVQGVFDELYEAGFRITDEQLTKMSEKSFDWKAYYTELENGDYGDIFKKLWVRERDNGFKYGYPYMQAKRAGKTHAQMTAFEKKGYGIYEQAISVSGGDGYVCALSEGKKAAKYNEFYGTKTPAQQNYGEYLYSSMKKYYLNVIIGTESLSGWDNFVKTYRKNGGDAVIDQVNQWYKV